MPFDRAGQPLNTTLADYLLPGPTEVPEPWLDHMETPSPYTKFGVKGIGSALYEEMPFDDQAQPLASTLADYMLPGATEVPSIRLEHMQTPSPLSCFGQKGVGEGGAIAPPAAIANAVNDALADLGVEITESPITPRRLLAAIAAARARA